MSVRRNTAEDDLTEYIEYLGTEADDPAITKLSRTDVHVIRQVFREGWNAADEHRRHPHTVEGECWT